MKKIILASLCLLLMFVPVCSFAEDSDTFEPIVEVSKLDNGEIEIVIEDSTLFTDAGLTLTVPCTLTEGSVLCDGANLDPGDYKFADGKVTFAVAKGGTYYVSKEIYTPPVDPPTDPEPEVTPSEPINTKVENETVKAEIQNGKATVTEVKMDSVEEGETVLLDFSDLKKPIKEVLLPTEAVETITEASADGVDIKLTNAEVKLDADTFKTLTEAMGDEGISLSVKIGSDALKELRAEQNKVVGEMKDTVVISAVITAGDDKISDLDSAVELTVEYKWDGKGVLRAAYVADDGTLVAVPVTYENGKATLSAKDFPNYVVYTEEALPFVDVTNPMDYFYDAVKWAYESKVTNGVDDTHFMPESSCKREEMVTFLWNAAGKPEPIETANAFIDVAEDAYYTKAVLWATENGITEGTWEATFGTGLTVTRGQVVTFLYRLAGSPAVTAVNKFEDVAEDAYYYDAVLWAIENKITDGMTETTFAPDDDCTRAQIVTFLHRYSMQ